MTYSKHWNLVHLLGGKCVSCGNENFFDLEIDHINNDGDGERKNYTNLNQKYLSNPNRAKQRLQILCKKCHETKHHPIYTPKKEIIKTISVFDVINGKMRTYGTMMSSREIAILEYDEDTKKHTLLKQIKF